LERTEQQHESEQVREILREMRLLEGRDIQLWSIAALVSLTLVAGFAALLAPREEVVTISARLLPVLLYGLISLVVLYNAYLLQQRRNLRFARGELVRQLMRAEAAENLAIRDPLTGLFNRRYMEHALETEVKRASRTGTSLTLMLFDLDEFGAINKRFGHLEGDRILKEFGRLLLAIFRQTDTVARYGGDEFIVILTDTDLERAQVARARALAAIKGWNAEQLEEGKQLSVSLGIGKYEVDETVEELLARADEQLRRAKRKKGDAAPA
jgi:diguanylate cyclase (GGDEF)-like protein